MKTMLDSRAGPPGTSPSRSARIPSTIWWTISAVDRFRSSPACPVAQNGQFIPHPACELMHMVTRSGYRISTDSTSVPSNSRHSVLRVAPASVDRCRTTVIRSGSNASRNRSRAPAGMSVHSAGSCAYRAK